MPSPSRGDPVRPAVPATSMTIAATLPSTWTRCSGAAPRWRPRSLRLPEVLEWPHDFRPSRRDKARVHDREVGGARGRVLAGGPHSMPMSTTIEMPPRCALCQGGLVWGGGGVSGGVSGGVARPCRQWARRSDTEAKPRAEATASSQVEPFINVAAWRRHRSGDKNGVYSLRAPRQRWSVFKNRGPPLGFVIFCFLEKVPCAPIFASI